MADFAELQTFVAVAHTGSFASAARQLGLSPAMIGRRIQALEQRYGAKLIERTTRAHRLTTLGAEFLGKASQIIDRMAELDELARPDGAALAGRIRLSAPTTLGITVIAKLLARFSDLHPAVSVEMNLNDRQIDLINEGYDLAIRVAELAPSSLVARRIGTYDFVCCAAPRYLEQHGTPRTLEDLASARCVINLNIVPRNQWPFRDVSGGVLNVQVRGSLELDNGEAQRAAALAGAGIIFAPRALVAADLKSGSLVEVLANFGKFTLPIHTVHPSRNFVPKRVSAFIEFLAKEMKALG